MPTAGSRRRQRHGVRIGRICDELDELDEHRFSDTYVNDREGDYTDEVTG